MQPVHTLVQHMVDMWEAPLKWGVSEDASMKEAHTLRLDISKATQQLGWQPTLSFEESLYWTVDWYKSYMEDLPMQAITQLQIQEYLSRVMASETELEPVVS